MILYCIYRTVHMHFVLYTISVTLLAKPCKHTNTKARQSPFYYFMFIQNFETTQNLRFSSLSMSAISKIGRTY